MKETIRTATKPAAVSEVVRNAADTIAEMAEKYPALQCVGMTYHPEVNGGEAVPCYTMAEETAESWNEKAAAVNRRSFILANGREPANNAEVLAWVADLCRLYCGK